MVMDHSGSIIPSGIQKFAANNTIFPHQRAKFFVSVFAGPGRGLYFQNIRSGMPFKEFVLIMIENYDSDTHQLSTQAQLERITIEQVMRYGEITELDKRITTLMDKINVLTPHAPPIFRSDEKNRGFVLNTALEFPRPMHRNMKSYYDWNFILFRYIPREILYISLCR